MHTSQRTLHPVGILLPPEPLCSTQVTPIPNLYFFFRKEDPFYVLKPFNDRKQIEYTLVIPCDCVTFWKERKPKRLITNLPLTQILQVFIHFVTNYSMSTQLPGQDTNMKLFPALFHLIPTMTPQGKLYVNVGSVTSFKFIWLKCCNIFSDK